MNYIFFDIDGVLNGTNENADWLDEEIHIDKVNRLIKIAKETNSRLVMSSTWRTGWNKDGSVKIKSEWNLLLHDILTKSGCQLYSITPNLQDRGEEIKEWLRQNATEQDDFICLDDEKNYYVNDSFFVGKYIKTAPINREGAYGKNDVVGLFDIHVIKAIEYFKEKNIENSKN